MPGQRSRGTRRARGSWLPRLAGMGLVAVLAAGGVIGYLAAARSAGHRPRPLPTKVMGGQTVGLVAAGPPGSGAAGPQSLLASRAGLAFSPVPPSQLVTGLPQWTANQMAGATYIFIYEPSDRCLTAAARSRLALQPCNTGASSQRWRPVHAAVTAAGHTYRQFASLSSGRCISVGAPRPATGSGEDTAGLAACTGHGSWRQLISFWWGI
jgi:hypothetical protein